MKRIAVLLLLLGGLLGMWRLAGDSAPDAVQAHPSAVPDSTPSPHAPLPPPEAGERATAEQTALLQDLKAALAGSPDHDLLGLIRKAQHDCPERNDICLVRITTGLPADRQAQLREILQRLPLLAARLADMPMSMQQTFTERLAAIHAARVETLGQENARLLFGKEEALMGYQATLDHFIHTEAAQLPLAQRLAQAETIRRQALGPYWNSLTQGASGRRQQYQAELALSLLDADSEPAQAQIKQQLRSRYLGAEQAARMARLDTFDAEQRARANVYTQEKQQILARYAGPTDAASANRRDSELNALRRRMFPDSFQQ